MYTVFVLVLVPVFIFLVLVAGRSKIAGIVLFLFLLRVLICITAGVHIFLLICPVMSFFVQFLVCYIMMSDLFCCSGSDLCIGFVLSSQKISTPHREHEKSKFD